MKKTYIQPVSTAIALEPTHMLAASTGTNSNGLWSPDGENGIDIKNEGSDNELSDDEIG